MALTKIALRRLKRLVKEMRALPPEAEEHFDMGTFYNHSGPAGHEPKKITQEALMDCGTVACAAGWAASIPYFQKAGLKFTRDQEGNLIFEFSNIRKAFPSDGDDPDAAFNLFFSDRLASMTRTGFQYGIRTPKAWADYAEMKIKQLEAE